MCVYIYIYISLCVWCRPRINKPWFCSVLSCALCTRVASAAAHLPKTAFKVKQAKTRGETISSKSRDEHKQNKLHEKGWNVGITDSRHPRFGQVHVKQKWPHHHHYHCLKWSTWYFSFVVEVFPGTFFQLFPVWFGSGQISSKSSTDQGLAGWPVSHVRLLCLRLTSQCQDVSKTFFAARRTWMEGKELHQISSWHFQTQKFHKVCPNSLS